MYSKRVFVKTLRRQDVEKERQMSRQSLSGISAEGGCLDMAGWIYLREALSWIR